MPQYIDGILKKRPEIKYIAISKFPNNAKASGAKHLYHQRAVCQNIERP
jgi:hypothetical protein